MFYLRRPTTRKNIYIFYTAYGFFYFFLHIWSRRVITMWTCSPNFPNLFLSLLHFTTVYFFSHRLVMIVKSHMVEMRAGCATVSRLKQQQSASLEPCQPRHTVVKAAKQCQIISCSYNTKTTGVINAKGIHTCTLDLRAGNDRSLIS